MKCDKCDNEATVHEVRIEGGKRREQHLCEQCARAEGVAPVAMPAPLTQLLSQFVTSQGEISGPAAAATGGARAGAGLTVPCPGCGLTYGQFRQNGLLGCPKCYEAFENQLGPLLARAHEGGTHHDGKKPRRPMAGVGAAPASVAGVAVAPAPAIPKVDTQAEARAAAHRVAKLKKGLAEAIASEQYEKAAKIRDELAHLEGAAKPAAVSAPSPPLPPATPKRRPPPPPPAGKEGA